MELGNLSNLTQLSGTVICPISRFWIFSENELSGAIPQSLTGLTKLERFWTLEAMGGYVRRVMRRSRPGFRALKDTSGPNCSGTSPPSRSPDLIVESPSVNDNTLTTGQSFTLRATVRNQGNASSAATTLRYYRSSNATISADDTEVGTDAVSSLSDGGTSAESISLNAPSSIGTYYYGACVDAVSGESNTDNNCSSGVSVTVSGGGGGASNLGACRVGLVVRPNQRCTVSGGAFINIGGGCFNFTPFGTGRFCSGSFNLNGLQGTRVGNDFRITAVP